MIKLICFAGIVFAIVSLIVMKKSKHFFKAFFLTLIEGMGALLAVNASGLLTGVTLSINALTLSTGAIFGCPGIIMLLICDILLI